MADFCKYCAMYVWDNLDSIESDFAGITKSVDFADGKAAVVICEGCGVIQVDPAGKCLTHTDEEHKAMWERPL